MRTVSQNSFIHELLTHMSNTNPVVTEQEISRARLNGAAAMVKASNFAKGDATKQERLMRKFAAVTDAHVARWDKGLQSVVSMFREPPAKTA